MVQYRPGGFQILPLVVKNLLIINGLVFLAQMTFDRTQTGWLTDTFALHDIHSVYFKPHQLITHLFMHGSIPHLLSNMFALWMFGTALENVWGPKKFLTFYILCGLGAAILHMITLYMEYAPIVEYMNYQSPEYRAEWLYSHEYRVNSTTVGASGAVFGCLAAYGYLFPNSMIYLYFLVPIKAKWFVILYAGFEFWAGIQNSAGDNIAHWAHLGGALVGFLLVLYWNKRNRRNFY
ncbi:MAG TPA: rhomboid family intramembrane serine protease [Chitinophagaceae bacterium]|nr:rhomboid family intramembrane serine protease [Chitinophagaceae bacterium]